MKIVLFCIISMFLIANQQTLAQGVPDYVPSDSLLGWWPFNGNADDESGNGNNGTVSGATLTSDRFGESNKAYNFSSLDNVIDLPEISTSIGQPYSQSSYSMWFKGEPAYTAGSVGVILAAYEGPFDYAIRFEVTRSIAPFYSGLRTKVYYRCPAENDEPTNPSTYDQATWHNIIVVIDGLTGSYNYYYDGELVPSMSFTFDGANNYYTPGRLWKIGTINPQPNPVSHQFYGQIDDIGIWDRALTDCEIQGLYNGVAVLEICNGLDDDCDGTADDGLTFLNYYTDADIDGYGDIGATAVISCSPVAGSVTNNTDCNDANSAVNPGATEVCNAIDDDCDGTADDGLTFITYFADADIDTYGDAGSTTSTCDGVPAGYVTNNADCNDANASVNPGAIEICNAIDDDCDGTADDGLPTYLLYIDADGDNFGDPLEDTITCAADIIGYVTDTTDCDDTNPEIYPGAPELLNGYDDNCNEFIDEGVGLVVVEEESGIAIYPNPAMDKTTLSISNQFNINSLSNIAICDLTGKIVLHLLIRSGQTEIDVSQFVAGIYFVNVSVNGNQLVHKLIIE